MSAKQKQTTAVAVAFGFVLGVAALSLSSCGAGAPSEEQAKQAWLAWRGNNLTRVNPSEVVSFRKTNGVMGEAFGVKMYEFQYKATLRCKTDGSFGFGQTEPYVCKAGQTVVDREHTLRFQKTENGWVTGP
jgi:hypothetical protein